MLSLGYLASSAAYLANVSKFCKELKSLNPRLDCNYGIGGFGVFAAVLILVFQIVTVVLLILRLKFLNTKIPGMPDQCSIFLMIVSCVAIAKNYFAT